MEQWEFKRKDHYNNKTRKDDEIGGKIRETLLGFGIRHEYVHSLTVKLQFFPHIILITYTLACVHVWPAYFDGIFRDNCSFW